jgi:hypothetical protein
MALNLEDERMFYIFLIFIAVITIGMMTEIRRARIGGKLVNEPAPWLEKLPLLPFIIFAAAGLALSIIVHVLAFFGITLPIKDGVFALHMGIFIIWIPVVALSKGRNRNDFFKQGPKWMQRALTMVFVYAIGSFIYFIANTPRNEKKSSAGKPAPANVVRGFSGHWILFYSAGLAALWNARCERRAIPPLRPAVKVQKA